MTHGRAVLTMLAATLLWSMAGVVSRQLESAGGLEVTFWRSAFNALALLVLLSWLRGPRRLLRSVNEGGLALWLSGACWSVMFTAFMVALGLTTVANVLVTMALGPLFTALTARWMLGHRLPLRTWGAIAVAGAGVAFMHLQHVGSGGMRHWLGTLVALAVPIAAAVNWTLLQRHRDDRSPQRDMLPAVLLGAVLSAAMTLPLALPFAASSRDMAWLGLLGVMQLAIPCLLAVAVARVLSAPEVSLLGQLEVVFGVTWAWLGAGEAPSWPVLFGGLLVLAALAGNEALALRAGPRRWPALRARR